MEQFIANGLCKGSIYALVALGFGLIYTTSGVFHLAHGAVYAVAAYFLYCLLVLLQLPFSIALLSSVAIAMALGVLIEIVVYRPLSNRKASGTVMLISSLGVYIVLVNLIALFFGNGSQILRSGAESTIILGNIILTKVQVAQFVVSLFFIIIYWLFLRWSPLGRVCRAVADDAELAAVLGVKVEATRLLVIAVGSSLAGVAATLSALDVGIDPFIGFPIVLVAVVACIIGGLHRFLSPALGGFLLGLMQSLIVSMTSAQWETAVTFALLIIFLLLRPQGLLGIRQRFEET